MQLIAVIIIVIVASIFLASKAYHALTSKGDCTCGCDACLKKKNCDIKS